MTIQSRVAAMFVAGSFLTGCELTDRGTTPEAACFANLYAIDGAEQAWSLEYHKTTNDTPTWSDLRESGWISSNQMVCPSGGTYSLGQIGQPPSCSVVTHAARYRQARPKAWIPGQ